MFGFRLSGFKWFGFCIVLSLAFATACKSNSESDSESSEPEAPQEPVQAVIEIEGGPVTSAATVQIELPPEWHAHDFFEGTWLPGDDTFEVSIKGETGCGGACSADAIEGNIRRDIAGMFDGSRNPGPDSHLTPILEEVDRGELPLGQYLVYRTSYPPAPEGGAEGRPLTKLLCYLHNPGDAFYVVLEASAQPELEGQIWPSLLESCQGATYTTP